MEATSRTNERLAALTAAGTSVWLDQIRRTLTRGGELERLVERGLRCAARPRTPRSSRRRSSASEDYDEQLERAGARRAPTPARSTRRSPSGRPGRRPTCCAPSTTRPTATTATSRSRSTPTSPSTPHRTMEQAREYWGRVDRPNLMIKIPGTDEGLPAIEQMIYEGMNINVTLLFKVEHYDAGRRGLHPRAWSAATRRASRSTSHSVASFFVSRVDTEVDKRLEALGAARTCSARPAWPTRAPPTSASRRSSTASASRRCSRPARRCSGRCGRRPASRTPSTPTRCTSTGSIAPRDRQHDADGDAAGRGRARRGHRRDGRPGPRRRTCSALADAGIDMTTSPTSCCATASTRS